MIRHLRLLLFAGLALMGGAAVASGLQVSPVSLTIRPTQNAEGLWLSNTGDNVVNAQVRVYLWTQEGFEDKLTPSRGLLVSPPMLQLPAEGRQLIRAIRASAPPNGPGAVEGAYRVIIDELPVDTQGKKGVQFVLRYSVPVFIAPAGASTSAPQLTWALRQETGKTILEVANSGGSHAQVADLNFTDNAGHRTAVHPGLLGYVLPSATMRWALKTPAATFAAGGSWEAMINGNTAQQNIQPVDSPR